tara:strand:- start:455 stop:1153 length:699 start_codon:yes stop_codon:yes gene_type:complete
MCIKFTDKYNEGKTILIDKSLDWTSFDVVKKLKFLIKCKKIGHAGTLDPLATGLLIICTGKNTKKINDIQNLSKTYTGNFTIGSTTPSHDLETEISASKPIENISKKMIEDVADTFLGVQLQKPPKFSAVKVEGERAYKLARENKKFILKEKEIEITKFKISEIKSSVISFEIKCSKGTYIRSIARDFGNRLGCGAYLSKLRRTKIGDFDVNNAYTIDDMVNIIKIEKSESN